MAFSDLMSANGAGGRRRFHGYRAISEMNVIPLVDVVLVLLIIFMITAHAMEFGLEVEVPKVKQVKTTVEELPVVTVSREGELYLNESPVNINLLPEEVRRRFDVRGGVYVRADKGATWEIVAQVFGVLGEAGIEVKAVTQPEEATSRRR